jgi:hypothetical protein
MQAMTPAPALQTRRDLDELTCEDCDGDGTEGLYLHCHEHPDSTTLAFYVESELRLECAMCGQTYAHIAVAG